MRFSPSSTSSQPLPSTPGANADAVPSIRRTLATYDVSATFFLTGRFVQSFPVKSRRIAADYLVGNHTMTHPNLTTLTRLQIRAEIRSAQSAIVSTTGEDPRRFFRFPFGAPDALAMEVVSNHCYVAFRWTVDTLGWKGNSGGVTSDAVVARVMSAARPGMIVLMHVGSNPDDGSTLDADALLRVIERLQSTATGSSPWPASCRRLRSEPEDVGQDSWLRWAGVTTDWASNPRATPGRSHTEAPRR